MTDPIFGAAVIVCLILSAIGLAVVVWERYSLWRERRAVSYLERVGFLAREQECSGMSGELL